MSPSFIVTLSPGTVNSFYSTFETAPAQPLLHWAGFLRVAFSARWPVPTGWVIILKCCLVVTVSLHSSFGQGSRSHGLVLLTHSCRAPCPTSALSFLQSEFVRVICSLLIYGPSSSSPRIKGVSRREGGCLRPLFSGCCGEACDDVCASCVLTHPYPTRLSLGLSCDSSLSSSTDQALLNDALHRSELLSPAFSRLECSYRIYSLLVCWGLGFSHPCRIVHLSGIRVRTTPSPESVSPV